MARVPPAVALTVISCLVAIACGGQSVGNVSEPSASPRTGPIASGLPPGVCALTYEQLNDPDATRIEAKLVARATLMKSDPEFVPTWHTDAQYFWIVAEVGRFTLDDAPMPASGTPPVLHNTLSYVQANIVASDPESVAHPCRGIAVRGDKANIWPAWFDRMPSIDDVKVR